MVKKIMQDVVSSKKDGATVFHPVSDETEKVLEPTVPVEEVTVAKKEFRKEMSHADEISPVAKPVVEELNREEALEKSPIFEKLKQRHEERESFSAEYAADQEGRIKHFLGIAGLIAGILVIIGIAVWSTAFYSASVTIYLKHIKVSLNDQDFQASTNATETIPYQIMTLSGQDTIKLTATGEKNVTQKASGTIVIYNNYKSQSQVLVKNTRFETPDGKIFRIAQGVSIPGMKTVSGKSVPGSLSVTVSADEAGPDYNIGLVDFTIPGFKGKPQFTQIFGRSKTAMAGGASGMVKTISDADVAAARDSLTKSLTDKLLADAKAQKPQGMVLYPDAVFFTFTDNINNTATAGDGKDVPFTLKGDLNAVLINQDELSRQIVKTAGDVASDEKINIDNIEGLTFAWKTPRSSVPDKSESLDFLLSGSANAVWNVDVNAFKNKLAGAKASQYSSIVSQFPGIEKTAKKDINPFWRTTYPTDIKKISVEVLVD